MTNSTWRVSVLSQQWLNGLPPYPRRQPDRSLARRDGLRIKAGESELRCVDADGEVVWTFPLDGAANAAHISGGRVLVTTDSREYTPWGHLGPAFLLDLADGSLVAELRGERGTVLRGGRFFLGLSGYGYFDTQELDRDGNQVDAWRSFGHYVAGNGIRVVETGPAEPGGRPRVVRLLPGGVVQPGPVLTKAAAKPVVLPDGTMLVLDAGVLKAVGRNLEQRVLTRLRPYRADDAHRFDCTLERTEEGLAVSITERDPKDSGTYTGSIWTLTLHPPGY